MRHKFVTIVAKTVYKSLNRGLALLKVLTFSAFMTFIILTDCFVMIYLSDLFTAKTSHQTSSWHESTNDRHEYRQIATS